MVRPTHEGPTYPLTTTQSVAGTPSGDDWDWDTGPVGSSMIDVAEGVGTPVPVSSIIFDADDFDVTDNTDGSVTIEATALSDAYELNTEGGQSVISAHGSTGATETIDPTAGNVHTLTLDADCTLTLDAPVGSGACTLWLWVTEDGTGGWDITWPGSVTEEGTHDTTAGTTQRCGLETIDGGTSWVATWIGGGGSDLTIEDEGTPLATAATTLDFVGAGVTASGAGAEKTITIPGVTEANVQAVGHYELLMTGSSPPEPIEDGTGADWLYVWVYP